MWSTEEVSGGFMPAFAAPRLQGFAIGKPHSQVLEVNASDGIAAILASDEDAEAWVTRLSAHEYLDTRDVSEIEIDGRAGTTLWVELPAGSAAPEGWCGQPCAEMFDFPDVFGWAVVEGYPNQIWVVELDAGSLVFFADSKTPPSTAFAEALGEWISAIEWQ